MSTVILLDWTADRVRAWAAGAAEGVRPVMLDHAGADMPLVLSLAERRLHLGESAAVLSRRAPHQIAAHFLPHLGGERRWQHGRHDLDARDALGFVLGKLRETLPAKTVFHLVPSYFTSEQSALLEDLTRQAGYRLLGIMRRGLALAGAAAGLTIDVDGHAASLTVTRLIDPGPKVRLQRVVAAPELALTYWKERIAGLAASQCIRDCRRDPRAQPETDQQLHDQISAQLEEWASNQEGRLALRGREWDQEWEIPSALVQEACLGLAQHLARQVMSLADASNWFFTPEASRLPGLAGALYAASGHQRVVTVLPVSLLPRTVAGWASLIERGKMPVFHDHDTTFPVLSETAKDIGPDTLPFPGRASPR